MPCSAARPIRGGWNTGNLVNRSPQKPAGGGAIDGTLTLHGQSRPLRLQVTRTGDGQYRATATVTQSQFGIKPYSGMFGALKLRDAVDIEVTVTLPATPGSPS